MATKKQAIGDVCCPCCSINWESPNDLATDWFNMFPDRYTSIRETQVVLKLAAGWSVNNPWKLLTNVDIVYRKNNPERIDALICEYCNYQQKLH